MDFVEEIERAVRSCGVLIALIGRQWLEVVDAAGRRRLDDPADFVRLEIGTALERNIRVIPALVHGTRMPATDALPQDLRRFARGSAFELSDSRWEYDVDQLLAALSRIPPSPWYPQPASSILTRGCRAPTRAAGPYACGYQDRSPLHPQLGSLAVSHVLAPRVGRYRLGSEPMR